MKIELININKNNPEALGKTFYYDKNKKDLVASKQFLDNNV